MTYPAAQRISCGEWLFFGALLLSFAMSMALVAWVVLALVRRLMGA
jgi:hypothetical protein